MMIESERGSHLATLAGTACAALDCFPSARKVPAMATLPRITISRFDHKRLEQLLEMVGERPDLDALREELDRADLVEPSAVPSDLVTMNSVVQFVELEFEFGRQQFEGQQFEGQQLARQQLTRQQQPRRKQQVSHG